MNLALVTSVNILYRFQVFFLFIFIILSRFCVVHERRMICEIILILLIVSVWQFK
jgi:hypothetical protein